ncbi:UNVERIFIED_CONTAM: hypothetical protein GTU68_038052 [Idotea baltica]|nr:hypothetical protein [Idotea baltica]
MLWIQSYVTVPYHDGSEQPVCLTVVVSLWAYAFIYGASILFFFLPLLLLITVYSIITRQLLRDPLRLNPERNHPQMRARRQVVVMLAMVVLSFFLCLLPLRVLFLWILLVPQKEVQEMGVEGYYNLVYFCRVMYYLNSCVNPILYAFMSTRFRSEFHKVLLCFKRRSKRRVDRNSFFTSSGPTGSVRRYASYVPSLRGDPKKKKARDYSSSSSSGSSKLIRSTALDSSSSKQSSHKESFV